MLDLPGYALQELLHDGARTQLFRARRDADGAVVLLKWLKPAAATPIALARFRFEFETMRGLGVDGVPAVDRLIAHQQSLAFTMADGGGTLLSTLQLAQQPDLETTLVVMGGLAEVLAALHAQRIIHKNINPAAILYDPAAQAVQLVDFSIASALTREDAPVQNPEALEGTLAYMAPEQTGRMNRTLDYRADFYAAGVTFYELLTGRLPFAAADALGLVHAHIAQRPPAPHEVRPTVPEAVSAVVMKLLAKAAEDRYQSARGLRADVVRCLDALRTQGAIAPFPPGLQDDDATLRVPQKLYGRAAQTAALLEAFDRASEGHTELLMVAGAPGIGKSALVHEVHKPIVRARGYFVSGKFDQYQRSVPYSALVQAFEQLATQLLTESPARIAAWREELLDALGTNARLLCDLAPRFERILGPQPPVPDLAPTEAQNRFYLTLRAFLRVCATAEHPLVIFLDDLQWADAATLGLVGALPPREDQYLLFIGAYRDNEVDAAHPLRVALQQLTADGASLQTLHLEPLDEPTVADLLSDTLHRRPADCQPLARVVIRKTHGNPFFLRQFLAALYEKGLVHHDAPTRSWRYELPRIEKEQMTDNVVALMVERLQALPEATGRLLQHAACIGNLFELDMLAVVTESDPVETSEALWPAVHEGLVLPIGDAYKLLPARQADERGGVATEEAVDVAYRFLHDRVQQAAYSLITDDRRQQTHLAIGRLLRTQLTPEAQEEHLFDLVNHLNRGRTLIADVEERDGLARLNLRAGRRAQAALAYRAAARHYRIGMELLPSDAWEHQYALALDLHVAAAEAAYLDGDFAWSEALGDVVLDQARTMLEKVAIYTIRIHAHIVRQQFQEALATAREVLGLLGVDLPAAPGPDEIGAGLMRVKAAIGDRSTADLEALPVMSEPKHVAAMRILMTAAAPAYFAAPSLFPLIVFEMVELSVRYGNTPYAAYSYGLYGTLQCSAFGDIEGGYPFGILSRRIQERFGAREIEALFYMNAHTIGHWKAPLRDSLPDALAGYRSGLETGDLQMGVFSALGHGEYSFYIGRNLAQVTDDLATYVALTVRYRQDWLWDIASIYRQAALNLHSQVFDPAGPAPDVLTGDAYDEGERLPMLEASNSRTALGMAYLCKTMLAYLFQAYDDAVAHAAAAEGYSDALVGGPHLPVLTFYASLARLAYAHQATGAAREAAIEQARAGLAQLQHWAEHAPSNYRQKADLVAAELALVEGRLPEAADGYEQAAEAARRHQYTQEEALAFERAGLFYLEHGPERVARLYLQEAYAAYRRWGAHAKVAALDRRHADLLATPVPVAPEEAVPVAAPPTGALDLSTALKAAQAISGELVLSKLLTTMMGIVIENAGAERGLLILEQDGDLVVEAEGTSDRAEAVLASIPVAEYERVCGAIVNYVAHTGEPVVLDDAARKGPFAADAYVQAHQTRSVLCTPLSHQGRRTGMLYFENNLTTGAFTPARLELLRFLSAEIAVSLENARLYRDVELANERLEEANRTLEQRVAHRTAELQTSLDELRKAQQRLIHQEKMASLGALTAGIAHEIKNPLNFITNFAELNDELADELREALDQGDDISELVTDLQRNARVIAQQGRRADGIVKSMMAHARDNAGERHPVDLNKLIEEHVQLAYHGYRVKVPTFTIDLKRHYDDRVGSIDMASQDIGRVVLNLLSNAFDAVQQRATDANGPYEPRVRVLSRRTADAAEIRVTDNGVGIAEEIRGKIFEPFFTTKPTGSGTGLGLSLSHEIVTQGHGGMLTVESREGEGSTFIVTLPLAGNDA